MTYTEHAGPWRDLEAGLSRLARSALTNTGTAPKTVESGMWRGRASAMAEGIGRRDGKEVFAAVRVVDLADAKASLTFIAVTTRSATAARRLQTRLNRSSSLLPIPDDMADR